MAKVLQVYLLEEFFQVERREGSIHSKFDNVINVEFDGRIITMMTASYCGIPDSIVIPREYFKELKRLPVGAEVVFSREGVNVSTLIEGLGWPPIRLWKSSCFAMGNGMTEKPDVMGFLAAVDQYLASENDINYDRQTGISEPKLQMLAQAVLEDNPEDAKRIAISVTGWGIGLTPSMDDAIVGIGAFVEGLRVISKEKVAAIRDWNGYIDDVKRLTTDISMKYLKCASEGRFSDCLLDLVLGMYQKSDRHCDNISKIISIGHSSGRDMLLGIVEACEQYSHIRGGST